MSCTSPWTYEKKVGRGWEYNEAGLTYDSPEFDDLDVYYNALGIVTAWSEEATAPVASYSYEKKLTEGYLYNEPGLTYNQTMFDDMRVYYNTLGQNTDWFYEDFIDYCQAAPYFFMDGEAFLFMDGTPFEF